MVETVALGLFVVHVALYALAVAVGLVLVVLRLVGVEDDSPVPFWLPIVGALIVPALFKLARRWVADWVRRRPAEPYRPR